MTNVLVTKVLKTKVLRYLSPLLFCLLLAACVSTPPAHKSGWQLSGRLGIKTATEANSLSIRWHQDADRFDIHFTGPLGIAVAHLYGDDMVATLATDDGIYTASSAAQLLKDITGLQFPVAYLVYWVQGEPFPDGRFSRQENHLSQAGWEIDYVRRVNGSIKKVKLRHPEVKITLLIKTFRNTQQSATKLISKYAI